jgi:predicted GNAT family N-acyltransferase
VFKRSPQIELRVAQGLDDLTTVMAIRAAVFLGEEDCSYGEEFDGHDTNATHIVGFIDGEPAGTIRLRWFADFVRFERLAIRRRHRSLMLANALIREAMSIARARGYLTATGLVRPLTAHLWRRRGAIQSGEPIETSDGHLMPMRLSLIDSKHNERPRITVSDFGTPEFERRLDHLGGFHPGISMEAAHA